MRDFVDMYSYEKEFGSSILFPDRSSKYLEAVNCYNRELAEAQKSKPENHTLPGQVRL